ncbi:MAG: molybdopterin oxidoreductase family protein [Candidatus Caldatribacteriota bacterium]
MSKIINSVCPKDCFGSCTLEVEVEEGKIIKVKGKKDSPVNQGRICRKANHYFDLLYGSERLLYPLQRVGGRGEGLFKRISWNQALDIITKKLIQLKADYGPEALLFYQRFANLGIAKSGALGFWYQFGGFTSTYGGLCDAAAQEAIKLTYGEVKHNRISDLENSDLIILWGTNPAYTNIHIMYYLKRAIDKGAKLITIDIRKNESGEQTFLHLNPRPGTDICLALGVAHQLIEEEMVDYQFINQYTFGFDRFKESVKEYPLSRVVEITGVPLSSIKRLINLIKEKPHYALICGMGVQRYTNAGQTIRAISLLPALTGSIGKRGGGFYFSDKQAPELIWPFLPQKPEKIRISVPVAKFGSGIISQKNPPLKGLWVEQANPLTSNPDNNLMVKAIHKLDLIVVVDLFLTDTARIADIVLPAASMYEYYDLISGYGHSYIQLQQKIIDPPGESKHESELYRLLGKKFGFDLSYLPENNLNTMQRVIQSSGLRTDIEKLQEKPYLHSKVQEVAFVDYKFSTPSKRIEFYSEQMQNLWGQHPLPVYSEPEESRYACPELYARFPLMLISSHAFDKMNSQFSSRESLQEQPFAQINPQEAKSRGIKDGERIMIYNRRGIVKVKVFITDRVPPGIVHLPFGWWEGKQQVSVNKLTGEYLSDIGYGTAFHNCLVQIRKEGGDSF